ncbi:MAG: hypothetical protein EZS28_039769 [Streblomastix strix]|uniref:B30.2/SPRY domain-containing protein n=1 Tax=Streblomastix strix TaxID=222440 RepID=A0A5J4U2W4_9EUKA|nr:MAG: hypothetical protein EZS28_039769 [Streblomastix strix]
MKYGEQQTDQFIKDLENKEKEKDEELQKLKVDLQNERSEKERIEIELRQVYEEKKKEKSNKEKEIETLKTENNKLKTENEKNKNEIEKWKPYLPQDLQININNPDPGDFIGSVEASGKLKISKKQNKWSTVSLSQVLENGVYTSEIEFFNSHNGNIAVGIVRDSYTIPAGIYPWQANHQDHMAAYVGTATGSGNVYYEGNETVGNAGFADNQIVKMEYNSEKGILIFFVAGIQQPIYISGIKEKVRFIVSIHYADSYCIIRSLKKLSTQTQIRVANAMSVQW